MAKVETERFFGNKGIIIMIRDGNKFTSAIFKDKKNADKFNRNNPSDVKKLLQLAKKTKFPKAIDESVNEDSMDWEKNFKWANDKELKVISKFIFMNPKGISGVIKMSKHKPFAFRRTIQKMAKKGLHERLYVPSGFDKALDRLKFNQFTPNNIKKLSKKFKVDYKDAVEFIKQNKVINVANKPTMAEASKEAMGIAGFTGTRGVAVDDFIKKNKIDARKLFNFVRKGNLRDRMDFVTAIAGKPNNKFFKMIVGRFAESVNEDKNQIVKLKKKVGKSEIKFYDALSKIEKKLGKKKYRAFLEKGLKDFKINAKHYDYRSNGAAEEKLFQLAK